MHKNMLKLKCNLCEILITVFNNDEMSWERK